MFEGTLVESTSVLRQRNRWPVFASIGVQAAFAAALLSIPLLHPEVVSLHAPQLTLFAPVPKPPVPVQPPPERVHVAAAESVASLPTAAPPTMAAQIHRGGFLSNPADADGPPATNTFNMSGNGPALPFSANPGGAGPVVVRVAEARSKPPLISSGVTNGMLLAPITPDYPVIAKASHTEGTVVIRAIISKAGVIESARVESGPPLLQAAALQAVERARYRPYLLNNVPTEVETTISIVFRMGS